MDIVDVDEGVMGSDMYRRVRNVFLGSISMFLHEQLDIKRV